MSSLLFSTAKKMARAQKKSLKTISKLNRSFLPESISKPFSNASLTPTPQKSGSWQQLVYKSPIGKNLFRNKLDYALFKPNRTSFSNMPLVVMLHGCTQNAYEMAQGSRLNIAANRRGFVALYPQQDRQHQIQKCWQWYKPNMAHGFAEADAIADLMRSVIRRYKLDKSRVYIAGISAGAGMAAMVALRHPDLVTALAMHSGPVIGHAHTTSGGLQTMRRSSPTSPVKLIEHIVAKHKIASMPALIIHGEQDRAVTPENAEQLAEQFKYINHLPEQARPSVKRFKTGTFQEYEQIDYALSKKVLVRLCKIKMLGHAWSGGDESLKFNSKNGPKSTLLMLDFFKLHRK
ncbi:MAG: PHB depolymerase family esterase [Alcaligenaceae bacterium]|nr:PHB depolymerase family esterase [Alcaligenaceae bacterium]